MRALLRILSPLLALILTLAGAALLVAAVAHWSNSDTTLTFLPWQDWAERATNVSWDGTTMLVLSAIVAVVGLLLLGISMSAGRSFVRLTDPVPEVAVTTSTRSLARVVGQRTRATDGVSAATVTASGKKIHVHARSEAVDSPQLRTQLSDKLGEMVSELPLRKRPRLAVRVNSNKEA